MAFLSALSERSKDKGREAGRLRAELAKQVQAKREQKRIAEEARLLREQQEYEEEMAARGLQSSSRGSSGGNENAGDHSNPTSPLRRNKKKNSTTQMNFASATPP